MSPRKQRPAGPFLLPTVPPAPGVLQLQEHLDSGDPAQLLSCPSLNVAPQACDSGPSGPYRKRRWWKARTLGAAGERGWGLDDVSMLSQRRWVSSGLLGHTGETPAPSLSPPSPPHSLGTLVSKEIASHVHIAPDFTATL